MRAGAHERRAGEEVRGRGVWGMEKREWKRTMGGDLVGGILVKHKGERPSQRLRPPVVPLALAE